MKTTTRTSTSDATVGRIVRERDRLDAELKSVQARIHEAERRSALPILEGHAPGVSPELPRLVERRDELFRALRLTRLALDMARGKA